MPDNTWYDDTGTLTWNDAAGWSLGRVPIDGDSVFITGPFSPNGAAPATAVALQSLDTSGMGDPNGFDAGNLVGTQLSIATGGYLLLASNDGQDLWYGNAALASTATFRGNSTNYGVLGDFATFKDFGANQNIVGNHAVFSDYSTNGYGRSIGDNCIFQDDSENDGIAGDNTTFQDRSLAFEGSLGTTSTSVTRMLDASNWFAAQVNAGTVYWNSTGLIGNGIWMFASASPRGGSSHTVGGGVLAGL